MHSSMVICKVLYVMEVKMDFLFYILIYIWVAGAILTIYYVVDNRMFPTFDMTADPIIKRRSSSLSVAFEVIAITVITILLWWFLVPACFYDSYLRHESQKWLM